MLTIFYILSIALMILLPVLFAALLRRRFVTPWMLFCVGILTFTASQVVHLPLNAWLADLGILPHAGRQEMPPLWQYALVAGLTAGVCEELARAAGYAILKRFRSFGDGLMMGSGHGGFESMIFGGVMTAAGVSALLPLLGQDLTTMGLSAQQLAAVEKQLQVLLGSPWLAFLPLVERLLAMTAHVIFSMLVLRAFTRRNPWYVVLAIAYHAVVDFGAVYFSQTLSNTNFWVLELAFAAILLPGVVWLVWTFPRKDPAEARHAPSLSSEWAVFAIALRKELIQMWRTKRVLVVAAVFGLFGMASPAMAYFMPQMFKAIPGAEQFAGLIPQPTVVDALVQYSKNITQFGFILAIFLGMSAVAGEKERGTASLVLSKPMTRWAFVTSKFAAQLLAYGVGFLLAMFGAYFYIVVLFGAFDFGNLALITFLLLAWLLPFVVLTLVGSVIGGSTSIAAGIALIASIVLLLLGNIPQYGSLMPSGLTAWAGQIGAGTAVAAPNGGALAASLALCMVGLVTAIAVFERQEL
jgi:ABC-2 type transport system permease protein